MAGENEAAGRPVAGLDFLRRYWPLVLAIGVGLAIYLQVRGQLEDLRVRVAVLEAQRDGVSPAEAALPFGLPGAAPPTPAPGDEPPACQGSLPNEQIQAVLAARGPEVFACAARRRSADPDLTGTVEMAVRINEVGQVDDIEYRSPIRDPQLEPCIRDSVNEWVFPAPNGGCAVIRLPFYFAPPDQGPQ